jgi:4-amino-4-deoxy-L-arabinose transferase-like glycosyltransferase
MNAPLPHRKLRTILVFFGIILLSSLFMLPYLGSVNLFDSNEINYAESSREMILTGDYLNVQIDFLPFVEKPPLFFWLQVASMKIFGINEFAARFPNFICGILTLMILYSFGKRIYGHRFGLFWVLSFGSAILPFFFFKSGIIDPWYNLLFFSGIAFFILYMDSAGRRTRMWNVALAALFLGLAVLTKGPVAVLIFFICLIIFLFLRRFDLKVTLQETVLFLSILLTIGGSWYLYQFVSGNGYVLREFIQYSIDIFSQERSGHGGFFGYYLVILLLGVFPASVIAMKSITKKSEKTEIQRLFKQWMYILILVIIVLYSIARTKLLNYSSLAYFPLTFLAAWVWDKWVDRKIEIGTYQVIMIFIISILYSSLVIVIPLLANHPDWLSRKELSFINEFTRAALQRDVHWSGYEWMVGIFLILGVMFSLIQILRRNTNGMVILHMVVLIYVTASLYIFTGRIEDYTQRVAVKFYKGLKGQQVYVRPLGFKSYAHLFYFDKQPGETRLTVDQMMENELDRDAYFVIQKNKKEVFLERYPQLEIILEKDGYVFTVKRALTN